MVILSSIASDDVNVGYGQPFHNIILVAVNGRKPRNLKHLVEICEEESRNESIFLRFDFTLQRLIVLQTDLLPAATKRVLADKKIEHDRSIDLRQNVKIQ